jgi:hypothetical protein
MRVFFSDVELEKVALDMCPICQEVKLLVPFHREKTLRGTGIVGQHFYCSDCLNMFLGLDDPDTDNADVFSAKFSCPMCRKQELGRYLMRADETFNTEILSNGLHRDMDHDLREALNAYIERVGRLGVAGINDEEERAALVAIERAGKKKEEEEEEEEDEEAAPPAFLFGKKFLFGKQLSEWLECGTSTSTTTTTTNNTPAPVTSTTTTTTTSAMSRRPVSPTPGHDEEVIYLDSDSLDDTEPPPSPTPASNIVEITPEMSHSEIAERMEGILPGFSGGYYQNLYKDEKRKRKNEKRKRVTLEGKVASLKQEIKKLKRMRKK